MNDHSTAIRAIDREIKDINERQGGVRREMEVLKMKQAECEKQLQFNQETITELEASRAVLLGDQDGFTL